jgi:hypothetical protein
MKDRDQWLGCRWVPEARATGGATNSVGRVLNEDGWIQIILQEGG